MPDNDQNFDNLVEHFERKIYGSSKGQLRLILLKEEFESKILTPTPNSPLKILDVAGGLGQIAIWLAQMGHDVTIADISEKMLERAKIKATEANVLHKITWIHSPLQYLKQHISSSFDLIIAHAILEWMDKPIDGLKSICQWLDKDSMLSLSFYNHHAITIHNLLRGNFYKVQSENYRGESGGLTPLNPLKPELLRQWFHQNKYTIESEMGLRSFSDYIPKNIRAKISEQDIIQMEHKLSHQQPFVDMARYVHFLVSK